MSHVLSNTEMRIPSKDEVALWLKDSPTTLSKGTWTIYDTCWMARIKENSQPKFPQALGQVLKFIDHVAENPTSYLGLVLRKLVIANTLLIWKENLDEVVIQTAI